MIKHLKRSI